MWTSLGLVLTILFATAVAYDVWLPPEANRPGAMFFNTTTDFGRIYTVSHPLTAPYARKFVDVGNMDGLVYLKRELKCMSDDLDQVTPWPLTIYLQSNSFSLSAVDVKLVAIPLNIYFSHESCPEVTWRTAADRSAILSHHSSPPPTYGLITYYDADCFKASQFITNLDQFMPHSIKNVCKVELQASDNPDTSLTFAIEQKSRDLVARNEACITSSTFTAIVDAELECPRLDEGSKYSTPTDSEWLVPSAVVSTTHELRLTFGPSDWNDADITQFLEDTKTTKP